MKIPWLRARIFASRDADPPNSPQNWRRIARGHAILLSGIVALAAALRLVNLNALGLANHYYSAAIVSMLQSWRNFFFVAAEPGGSVSVDKPPLGFWVQAASARALGVNTLGLILPQIAAGLLSILVVERLVRRSFGRTASLLAALVLAVTPVAVAVERNNTIDSLLILALLLAAWAFIRAAETRRWRPLLLGAALVGIGFNIKMLEAYLPLPAFYALYLTGSGERWGRKLGKLAATTALLLAVSLSWAVIVDLTPADQRPYVGSSGDNSEMSLMIGYNGVERLLGRFGRRGGAPGGPRAGVPGGAMPQPGVKPPNMGAPSAAAPRGRPNAPLPGAAPGGAPRRGIGGGDGPGGMGDIGQPGPWRLFTPPLSKEVSWLLPLGLASGLTLLIGARRRWPLAPTHQALVLWGGWLLTGGVFFSVAGFFHEYYLALLAPPLAALIGIGVIRLSLLWGERRWLATALLLVAAGATLALQIVTARAFIGRMVWLPVAAALLALGAGVLIRAAARNEGGRAALIGFACVVGSLLVTPTVWSALTALHAREGQSLPSAYGGQAARAGNPGGERMDRATLSYLTAHTQGVRYLVAAPSAMQGADYVLATGRPVLYLGGFAGQDEVVTAEGLAQMVCRGELRYILRGGRGGGGGNRADLAAWVEAHCAPVEGYASLYECRCDEASR